MSAEPSKQVEQIYHAARECAPAERAGFIEQACAGNESLRREIESLLAEDGVVRSFLETPALEIGQGLLFETPYERGRSGNANYDVTADGQRFIMVKAVVLNWLEELKQRVPIR